jgi:ArsR family transcriptional regulator
MPGLLTYNRHLTVTQYVHKSRHMKTDIAIEALAALAQPTRLEAFRLLVKHEPDGLPAGEIARRLDVPHNTMSTHLGILNRAGLITVERHSRSLIYRVELKSVRKLVLFLLKDCCNGQPELCTPLIEDISKSCSTSGACCG